MKISHRTILVLTLALSSIMQCAGSARAEEDAARPLLTRWASQVSPENVWQEYPRPQLVRKRWLNLNGTWDLAITKADADRPTNYAEKILVPFPVESYLSGVGKRVPKDHRLWYRRTFSVDPEWRGRRLILHFGAVDWHSEVWVNGQRVGEHRGGYDPFSFDITDMVDGAVENVITVKVADPTDSGSQPCGKQRQEPGGIWYTPVTGIWQTVWLEPVPQSYVRDVKITPNFDESTVKIVADVVEPTAGNVVKVEVSDGGTVVSTSNQRPSEPIVLTLENAKAWSPDEPFLYDLTVRLTDGSQTLDAVESYFGMRSIGLGTDQNGQTRIMLNGLPVFQYGPLDQGYWPDGLYTAPSDEAMRYDLEVTKKLGFNMVRKHVKVEPARWYHWCDRLGLLVWQDMPNGGEHATWPADGVEVQRSAASAKQFRTELQALVDKHWNAPCVVVWVPFNEAWGQFDTKAITAWLEQYDPTRLVISASGGNDFGVGHINDDHFYPGPGAPPAERDRAAVLGEFGGLGLPLRGHTWQQEKNWGYRSYKTREQLTSAYEGLISKLRPLVESHLSAAVYTQTTDVEVEINGLMTYDRERIKPAEAEVQQANAILFEPLPPQSDSQQISASVLAWWRFEDNVVGSTVNDLQERMGAIAAHDSSGHNNHLFAFSSDSAPSISKQTPSRSFGLVSERNRQSLDDTATPGTSASTRDLYSNPDVARTHMDTIDRYPFTNWTIEASFCLSIAEGDRIVLSKEEDRQGILVPQLQLGVFGNEGVIGVEMMDTSDRLIELKSDIVARADEWWHVAVTCDDGQLRLYVAKDSDSPGEYRLVGKRQVADTLTRRRGTWLVGRGCESGKIGRDFLGWIDEVRITTKALKPSQFLFAPGE